MVPVTDDHLPPSPTASCTDKELSPPLYLTNFTRYLDNMEALPKIAQQLDSIFDHTGSS